MAENRPKKKIGNGLVAMSSAAVLAVYTAGYTRTRTAAQQLEARAAERVAAAVPATRPAPAPAPAPVPVVLREPAPAVPQPTERKTQPGARREQPVRPAPITPQSPSPADPVHAAPTTPAVDPVAPAPAPLAPAPEAAPPLPVSVPKIEAAAPAPPAAQPAPTWKDGTYTGWGSSRHGDIQAAVVIAGGRIESATIAQCRTRYSCSVIEALPPEVPQRQSAEVDYVSGATQSANAFYWAVIDALSKAK